MEEFTFGSAFSGIEAASVAWNPLGMKALWFSEIEKFPCAVLAARYPDVPNLGDVTRIHEHELVNRRAPSALVGGSPCQGFSIAGLRKGLTDDRSNLARCFVRLALQLRSRGTRWLVWENVPGVFTTNKGQDFCDFLSGLTGVDLSVPQDGWRNSGVVVGAKDAWSVAWRVDDAQYAGVPQRRRRIFLVGHSGDWRRAAATLFEQESLQWNPPPSREKRKEPASYTPSSIGGHREGVGTLRAWGGDGGGGGSETLLPWPPEVAPTLDASYADKWGLDDQHINSGGVYSSTGEVSHCLNAGAMGRMDYESETLLTVGGFFDGPTHSSRADGFDASEDGTGRGTPLVLAFDTTQVTSKTNRSNPQIGDPCHTLSRNGDAPTIAFTCKDAGGDAGDLSPTLRGMGHNHSHANSGGQVAVAYGIDEECNVTEEGFGPLLRGGQGGTHQTVAFTQNQAGDVLTGDVMHNLSTNSNSSGRNAPNIAQGMAVRRLTVIECSRLQGFHDTYLFIDRKPRKIPEDEARYLERHGLGVWFDKGKWWTKVNCDGPMYKALGNSIAIPCLRWIGRRMLLVDAVQKMDDYERKAELCL